MMGILCKEESTGRALCKRHSVKDTLKMTICTDEFKNQTTYFMKNTLQITLGTIFLPVLSYCPPNSFLSSFTDSSTSSAIPIHIIKYLLHLCNVHSVNDILYITICSEDPTIEGHSDKGHSDIGQSDIGQSDKGHCDKGHSENGLSAVHNLLSRLY